MTHWSLVGLTMLTLLAPGSSSESVQDTLPMPCLQLVSADEVREATGEEMTLRGAYLSAAGDSGCDWSGAGDRPRALRIGFTDRRAFPPGSPTAAGAYEAFLAAMKRREIPSEPVRELGEAAALFLLGDATIVVVRRADGVLKVSGMGVTREQTVAAARRGASAPSPRLGTHVTIPEPTPVTPATAQALNADEQRLPCVQLLTEGDVRAAGRRDVLVEVLRPRRGFSSCVWRETSEAHSGFRLTVATAQEFADERVSGPAEYFASERKGLNSVATTDSLQGLGLEALITRDPSPPIVMVRRQGDVLTLSCETLSTCTRELVLALIRGAVKR